MRLFALILALALAEVPLAFCFVEPSGLAVDDKPFLPRKPRLRFCAVPSSSSSSPQKTTKKYNHDAKATRLLDRKTKSVNNGDSKREGVKGHQSGKNKTRKINTNHRSKTSTPSQQRPSKRTKLAPTSLRVQLDYARNGHAAIRSLLSPQHLHTVVRPKILHHARRQELLAWQQKVEVASDDPQLARSCQSIDHCRNQLAKLGIPYESLPFLQFFHTRRSLPCVDQLAHQLAQTAAVLMDVSSVRLYQDALFWKRSGDGPTPWHVDARMAPFDTSHMVTLWIPLQEVPSDGTALLFCSKSHNDFALPYWSPYNDDSLANPKSPWNQLEDRYCDERLDHDPLCVHHMPLSLGDVTAHSGWTLHCANDNPNQEQDRLALAITYVDGRAPVRQQTKDGDSEDAWSYQDWIHQVKRGRSDWDHPLVPIIWTRS